MLRIAFAVFCATPLLAQGTDPHAAAEGARGKRLYDTHCSVCHGLGGTGGRGPVLANAVLPRGNSEDAIAKIVSDGLGEMPNFWQLEPRDAKQIAAYVRTLSRVDQQSLPGEPERGREIFKAKNCSGCHIVNGEGSAHGPELTSIGSRRAAEYLRASVLKPGADVDPDWWVFTAVLENGQKIRGRRLNEDTFTMQLEDASGRLHSFRKLAMRSLSQERGASMMPSFEGQLSPSELDDLVAYLATLREVR